FKTVIIYINPDIVRLEGGADRCSGRVEVYRWGQWGTVAQYNWDLNDAAVVCRQLGCGSAVVTPIRAHFGEGSGRVLLRDVSCNGSESALRDCGAVDLRHIDFPHKFDAGVICSDYLICFAIPDFLRLVGGADRCSGRVEVKFNQSWATVCDADFDWQDAQVVCRELDCGGPLALHRGSHFGQDEGAIWSKNFQCEGHESFLHECLTTDRPEENCTHGDDVTLICHRGIRLKGGAHSCSGRLEVQHGKIWGTVCDADFDWQDAEVVCRSLDCGEPAEVVGTSRFGPGEGQVWAEEFQCRGNESHLVFCPKAAHNQSCAHDKDVGLVCSGKSVLNLKLLHWVHQIYKRGGKKLYIIYIYMLNLQEFHNVAFYTKLEVKTETCSCI
uniref:SRCR domain-containing protein n=1 Tax=Scleropages formosus TaxID=113540 RepID=A0A8C9QT93_SCLFO